MGRSVKDSKLDTRDARLKLKPKHPPYWRLISTGLHLGYRRSTQKTEGVWYVRRLGAKTDSSTRYDVQKIGRADDYQDADAIDVLDFKQAQTKAIRLGENPAVTRHRKAKSATLATVAESYMEWFKAERKSYQATKSIVDAHILPSLGSFRIADLTAEIIEKWLRGVATAAPRVRGKAGKTTHRKPGPSDDDGKRRRKNTANRILTVLKAILNYAKEKKLAQLPFELRDVKPYKNVDAASIVYLDRDEAQRLINAALGDFRALVQGALFTGARYGELINLKVGDFLTTGTIHIRESKSGRPRHVPLNDAGYKFFERLTIGRKANEYLFTRDGDKWGKNHQVRPLKEACAKAKIKEIGFHALRHSYGSILAMQGQSMRLIADLLGHSDTRITEKHYAHIGEDYKKTAVKQHLPDFEFKLDNIRKVKQK